MEAWKIQLCFLLVCTLLQIYDGLSYSEEEERWFLHDWQGQGKSLKMTRPIATLMKRSKPLRFYGLMGKRSGNKAETGLMRGKLPSRGLPAEWDTILY
uniref:uncharacterized protein si:ch211-131k2.2 n=1 Tax=Doryrhamphus excisus TaxID=161450 RepID=UPI0025ADCBC5|nr:uncharacterized protein si:ch211-131k2.2 [Doryrhamphus excisus]XP_057917243.1 uncharacterized protein si:ch211-131k2.2 [Doryrhamphus excisus]